jgi:hypothetical protein
MSASTALFAAIAVVNTISATVNTTFLIMNRNSLQPTQRLAPWLLGSSIFQCIRCYVVAALGQTDTAIIIYDASSTITFFCGFTYFVMYILLLLKQSHVAVGQELPMKKVYAYYVMHCCLVLFGIYDVISKNILHTNFSTGIKSGYYLLVTVALLVSFNYMGFHLISIAMRSAAKLEKAGVQNMKANLSPLKKTLGFFSFVCIVGIGIYAVQTLTTFNAVERFPRPFGTFELFTVVLLAAGNFLNTFDWWIYLDKCERRRGKDSRMVTKKGSKQITPPAPTRMSRSAPHKELSVSESDHGLASEPGTAGPGSPPGSPPASPFKGPGEGPDLPAIDIEMQAQPPDQKIDVSLGREEVSS